MSTRTIAILVAVMTLAAAVAAVPLASGSPRRDAAAVSAAAAPGRLIVGYRSGSTRAQRLATERATGTHYADSFPGGAQELDVDGGRSSVSVASELRARPEVAYAVPDYRVHASDFIPNDPGFGGPGGWQRAQWNFDGPYGVNAPAAWSTAIADHAAGGRGVVVAVIDSGVAFENYKRFRRSPELPGRRFVAPFDFLNFNRHPDDEEGHGTHVTSTIVEKTNNRRGVTGLAYGATIMPLRVLDANGNGDGATVARAIRYAVKHHARVINLSVEFDTTVHASDIPDVIGALRFAYNHGVVIVGASGNEGRDGVSYPAASKYVIAVGASTADGCLADYSNYGPQIAVVAPGGGSDAPFADDPWDQAHCAPDTPPREIVQETFRRKPSRFQLLGFEGTSFATPHVTSAVALLLATRRLGARPTPAQVRARLMATARDLGPPGFDQRYGAGLLDIAAALGP